MAAPTFITAGTGVVIATGTDIVNVSGSIGDFYVLQVVQDGTAASAVSVSNIINLEDLAGTGGALTLVTGSPFDVGSPVAALQHLWVGRFTSASPTSVDVTTTGNDLYCRAYAYRTVNTGTTLASVIENATAGTAVNGVGTSTTVSDTGVTTLGVDRLALNFVGINDDATGLQVFTGATGGTWENFQIFESSTGTDATAAMETAAMASAGTIDGGSDTITSDGWGVVGFALIGTTVPSVDVSVAWLTA